MQVIFVRIADEYFEYQNSYKLKFNNLKFNNLTNKSNKIQS